MTTYKEQVFVCGLSNSGKSALINSLIGRDTAARIRTDDNDEGTTSIHQYEGPNSLVFIDTPGLDTLVPNDKFENEFIELLDKATTVLFCIDASTMLADKDKWSTYFNRYVKQSFLRFAGLRKHLVIALTKCNAGDCQSFFDMNTNMPTEEGLIELLKIKYNTYQILQSACNTSLPKMMYGSVVLTTSNYTTNGAKVDLAFNLNELQMTLTNYFLTTPKFYFQIGNLGVNPWQQAPQFASPNFQKFMEEQTKNLGRIFGGVQTNPMDSKTDDEVIEFKIVCENVRQALIKDFVRNLMSQKVAYDVQWDKYIEYEGSFSSRTKLIQLVKTVFNANDIDIHRALFDYYKMKKPEAETK